MPDSLISNNTTTNIFKQAPVAIVIFRGAEFVIEFANDFYLEVLGKSANIIGKPLFESFPELKNQGLKEILNTILVTGIPYNINEHEIIVNRNDTLEKLFFNCAYQPLRESNNIITGIIVVFSEITEQINARKLVEDSEKRYNSVFMKSPFAFAILKGKEMIIALANESIRAIWKKGENVIGKGLFEVLPEVIEQGFPDIINKVFTTGEPYYGYEMQIFLNRNDELEECYFNFVYQPYREADDTISGIVLIAYEVTEQVFIKKAVAESEEKFRMMTDLMPVKVSFGDVNGVTNYFNQRWIDYTGLSLEELIESGWDKITHPDDVKISDKKWKNALKNGTDFEMELRVLDKNKHFHWHLSRVKPIRESNGTITHWIGINTEIHSQKTQNQDLKESLKNNSHNLIIANENLELKKIELDISRKELQSEYSRKLIEASHDPLVAINIEGKIMDMNEAMIKVTDKSREQLLNSNFSEYFTDQEKAKKIYKEVFEKGFVSNFPLVMKDGKLTDVLFNGSVFKDENEIVLGAVVVARDITAQKIQEKQLTEAKIFAELATKIAEDSRQNAEDAVKSKQQFLSNMSHEIRTPMNAIIGFTKVVLKTNLTAKQKQYLMAIKMSGDSLIVLINDILDLAKVDSGKMTFEKTPFKLSISIAAMLHLFETKIQEKNLELIINYDNTIPEVIVGDPIRLHQIILNLISNSVKFTNSGKITVDVKMLSQDDKKVTINFAILDTGIGIKPSLLSKIFENFQQATDTTSRLYGGTGLGLAIVKQLVEAQGGKIKLESKVNKGSIFSFALDFSKTTLDTVHEPEIQELDSSIKNTKVLVVEDMELNQLLMKTLLDDLGFECDISANGKLAIEKLQTKSYDIILMDLQMPEMNGFQATEYIRKKMKLTIPIIALTADVTTVDVDKCKAVGMNDYISKPVDERLLYSKLIAFSKKPIAIIEHVKGQNHSKDIVKYVDMSYLNKLTKSDPKLMSQMIDAYLTQTPPLILTMKQSLIDKDWKMLQSAVHKMIPSFAIMGIKPNIQEMAKKIQEYAYTIEITKEIYDIVDELEKICSQTCIELELELKNLKKK